MSPGIPGGQVGFTVLVVRSVGFLAVCALANGVDAGLTLCIASVAPVLRSWMHLAADLAGRKVAAFVFSVTKSLAFVALG